MSSAAGLLGVLYPERTAVAIISSLPCRAELRMAQQRHEDSDDDTYVRVGSAFERLETEEDVQKAKAKKDKESYVTDEQGRRRFHGAFTGGFSAGYFNTVGSKEGMLVSCNLIVAP